jgi:hypothetical protein
MSAASGVSVRQAVTADELAAVLAVLQRAARPGEEGGSVGDHAAGADGYERWRRMRIAALRTRP